MAETGTRTQLINLEGLSTFLDESKKIFEPTLPSGTDGQVLKLAGGKPKWGTDNTPTTFSWAGGTTAGPTGSLSGNGMSAVDFPAVPSASASASGVVTTGDQTFVGVKTFNNTIVTRTNTGPALVLRNDNSYMSTINYDTAGNEALAINLRNSATSFMVNHGVDGSQWTAVGNWTGVTPTLQAKNKCVYINELIPHNTSPSYNLKVNGTSYFSDKVYIGSSSSYISYNSSTGALEFNC